MIKLCAVILQSLLLLDLSARMTVSPVKVSITNNDKFVRNTTLQRDT